MGARAAEHHAAAGAGLAEGPRAARERLFEASTTRTEHGDANDTRTIIQRLAQLRAQKAKLLGFTTYAAYALDDQMAKTPDNAIKLLTDIVPAATAQGARRGRPRCRR